MTLNACTHHFSLRKMGGSPLGLNGRKEAKEAGCIHREDKGQTGIPLTHSSKGTLYTAFNYFFIT